MRTKKIVACIIAGLIVFLSLTPTYANAASSSEIRSQINELKKEKEAIQEKISEVKEQYQQNSDEIADIIARKNVIDQEIQLLYTQIANMNDQISAYNTLIDDKQDELDNAENLFSLLSDEIGSLELTKIRPQHLNALYSDLKENGVRADTDRAVATRVLKTTLHEMEISKAKLAKMAGVAASTITNVTRGDPIRIDKAEAIAAALECDFDELFKVEENRTPLSDKTILEHHRLISTILAQAEKEMLITYNPAARATPPKPKKPKPDYYQPDEMDEILTALENAPLKWKTITYLLIDTGCRRGEILGLKPENVDYDTGLVVIDHALLSTKSKGVYEGETKTGSMRAIRLAPQSLELLRKWKTEQLRMKLAQGDRWVDSGYIFTQDDGSRLHPDSITDWLGKFSKKHNLPHIHPHAFRHTAASTMIANGVDLVTTANELGHANASTTASIYAHQIAIAKAKAADVRAGVFAGRSAKPKKKRA